jgi:cellobiose-specific phosphotransferase system component IIC
MKKLISIFLCTSAGTLAGLITRPSYTLIGQLNWQDVITKGQFLGSIPKFFTQSMIDESFFWVLKFSGSGLILGVIVSIMLGGTSKGSKKKAKT